MDLVQRYKAPDLAVKVDSGARTVLPGPGVTMATDPVTGAITISTGGSSLVKIAVLGDSLSTQHYSMAPAWPSLLEQDLRSCSANVEVYNCSVAGHSFYRANTQAVFGTNTAVAHTISLAPDIVIVALGFNDTVMAVDGRSLAQAQADSLATFSALRAALPNSLILYLAETPYDTVNYSSPATFLHNKATIGTLWQKKTSGYLAGLWTVELLDDQVSATNRARLGDWKTLNTTINSYSQIDVKGVMNIWKIHRMGGALYDMLHVGPAAAVLQAGYAMKYLLDPAFAAVLPELLLNGNTERNDPDALFSGMFSFVGSSWVQTGTSNTESVKDSLWRGLRPGNWYLPRDINLYTNVQEGSLPLREDQVFTLSVTGARPNTAIQVSVNGGSFGAPGANKTTPQGSYSGSSPATQLWRGFGYGPNTFVHRVDDIAFDPMTFSFLDATASASFTIASSRNLVAADAFARLITPTSSPPTLTIQTDGAGGYPAGTVIYLINQTTSAMPIDASLVTMLAKSSHTKVAPLGRATLERTGSNLWFLSGDTSA